LHFQGWRRWCRRLDDRGFIGGGRVDLRDKPVSGGRNCFDEAWLPRIVVQGFTEEPDGAGEGVFSDGGVPPNGVEKLLLADETTAVLDEVEEQAKGLWLEGDGGAVRNQAEGGVISLEAIEAENQRGAPCAT
jgi:hypothetical protein